MATNIRNGQTDLPCRDGIRQRQHLGFNHGHERFRDRRIVGRRRGDRTERRSVVTGDFNGGGRFSAFVTACDRDVTRHDRRVTRDFVVVTLDDRGSGTARQTLQPTQAGDAFEQQAEQQGDGQIDTVAREGENLCDPRRDGVDAGLVLACTDELPLGFYAIGCLLAPLCHISLDAERSQLGRERFAPSTQRGATRHALFGTRIGE